MQHMFTVVQYCNHCDQLWYCLTIKCSYSIENKLVHPPQCSWTWILKTVWTFTELSTLRLSQNYKSTLSVIIVFINIEGECHSNSLDLFHSFSQEEAMNYNQLGWFPLHLKVCTFYVTSLFHPFHSSCLLAISPLIISSTPMPSILPISCPSPFPHSTLHIPSPFLKLYSVIYILLYILYSAISVPYSYSLFV